MPNNNISNEIFKSPIRKSSNRIGIPEPLTDFVDYTPRRLVASQSAFSHLNSNPNLESNPNSISYARERRSYYYHQLAKEADDPYDEADIMDSPVVRRHFGVSVNIADIDDEHTTTTNYFNKKIKLAQDQELLESKKEWNIEDFDVGKSLGDGKFGVVYIAREIRSQHVVAIKILKKIELEIAKVVPFLKREVEIQAHLNHPNIVRLYGYFHDEENIYLVQEYAGGHDLYALLVHCKRFTEAETVNYILQLASALKYMHSLGVIHRDIKLENILVSHDGTLKIADFGWAVYDPKPRRNTFCGTLDYLPPEMIQHEPHSHSVDVWALGILCFEFLTGSPPFENAKKPDDHEGTYNRIIKADVIFPEYISIGAKSFILKLLQRDPSARMNIADIQFDPWIKSFTS